MELSRANNIPVAGHIPWNVSLEDSVRAGLHSIEHLTGSPRASERRLPHATAHRRSIP